MSTLHATHLELFVVKNLLDRHHLISLAQFGPVDHAKCSFADHFDVFV